MIFCTRWFFSGLGLGVLMWAITGCAPTAATKSGSKKSGDSSGVSLDPQVAEIEELKAGLKTPEDSAVASLLQGYRLLTIHAQSIASAKDRERIRTAHRAYSQLEYSLRRGGIRAEDRGERLFKTQDGNRVSLQNLLQELGKMTLQTGVDGEWEKAEERSRDILKRRNEFSRLIEDANWVIALSEALRKPIPEEIKKRLRRLHESYTQEAPHDEIVKQVNGLLPDISDEKFRKEIKKLANRAWDRDRQSGRFDKPLARVSENDSAGKPNSPSGEIDVPPKMNSTPTAVTNSGSDPVVPVGMPSPDSLSIAARGEIDTLIQKGRYLEAAQKLDVLAAESKDPFVKERRSQAAERFCEDRRKSASGFFAQSRKAASDTAKALWLRKTLGELDSCLFHFPEAQVVPKVRRNREMVEKELKGK